MSLTRNLQQTDQPTNPPTNQPPALLVGGIKTIADATDGRKPSLQHKSIYIKT